MSMNTIPALLARGAERFGDHDAIVDGSTHISYAALADIVRTVSAAYVSAGVAPGDRVAVWAPNRAEFILAFLGAQRIGASLVPLNTRYRGYEAHTVLARSRASFLVVADGFLDTEYTSMLQAAGEGEPGPIVAGLPELHTVVDVGTGTHPATIAWSDFVANGSDFLEQADELAAAVTPSTVCDILFTSGTTGVPKGVMSTHSQTIESGAIWARNAGVTDADRYAIVNPFFHSFGYKAGVITSLTAGATVYPVPTFDPVAVMSLIETQMITVMPGAPTIFLTLINHPRLSEFDLSSLRYATAGSTSVAENLFEQMKEVLGFETVAQAYGLTECLVVTQSRRDDDLEHIAQTTGPAVEGIELRVVDLNGNDVDMGVDGEVLVRGENMMLGYFEDPQATAEAIDSDGWLHTGDVGRLDEHGCLKITDRMKDMFIVGGFNVYPAEVESVLATHPAVVEAAVVGMPDERLGTVGCAYVVPRQGVSVEDTELTEWCRARVANFKVPRKFVVVNHFPRNASNKILKRELRETV